MRMKMKILLKSRIFCYNEKIDFNFLVTLFNCLGFSKGYMNLPIGSVVVNITFVMKPSAKKPGFTSFQYFRTIWL